MKRAVFFSYGFLCLVLISPLTTVKGETTNLALSATVTTSYVSSWETLGAVKDGYEPSGSSDYTHGAYGNWAGESEYNKYNWVQYEWSLAKKIVSTSVYWWDDGSGIDQPVDAYIEYFNGTSWIKAGSIGTSLNQYNTLDIEITANKIRIWMKSTMATGILEWKVMGIEGGPCTATTVIPFIRENNGTMVQTNTSCLISGDSVLFSPEEVTDGTWSWSGPGGFTSTGREVKIKNLLPAQSGTYTCCLINSCGAITKQYFYLTVSETANNGEAYTWPVYNPTISYDFRDEYPDISEPTKELDDCAGVVGTQSSGWWTFKWGARANTLVTSAAITPMLARMNKDFAYFRDVMGWPPDKRAKNGYRSAIYLYGSGLCTDNASNTETGGWQSAIEYQGEWWPMVLISYYPVYCYDPSCPYTDRAYQTGAVVHEGIHSVLADLPGCKEAGWFQEGGNTWLQQEATARQTGDHSSMGFLNGPSFLAPFMPIECYSGWLQDDSFGGPSGEGVNMESNGTQICTWRNLLGGVQYSNTFPTFLGMTLGVKSIPWIWRYCPGRVLEGMAAYMGEGQIRRLIMEYRAKQALLDMGEWTQAIKTLVDSEFGTAIKSEWSPTWLNPTVWYATPYAKTTNNGSGLLTPEYRTTPGWSGANQIPLKVSGERVTVNFQPKGANMMCMLCYRTKEGQKVYSQPVYGGDCTLKLDLLPANNIVFAVICNTDYIYEGESTRLAHFDYRLQLVEGVTSAADTDTKWYDWTKDLTPSTDINDNFSDQNISIYPNPLSPGQEMNIIYKSAVPEKASLEIWNMEGIVVHKEIICGNSTINTKEIPFPGIYFLVITDSKSRSVQKLIIK